MHSAKPQACRASFTCLCTTAAESANYKHEDPHGFPARGTRLAVANNVQQSSRSPTKARRCTLVILVSKNAKEAAE